MGVKDKVEENDDNKKKRRELPVQERWLDWVKLAPLNALKFTLIWAVLGGNIVLLTTQSKTWPFDYRLERLFQKRLVALKNDDNESVKEINQQLEDDGVIIDTAGNKWSYKEFSGELDSGCYRIPVSLSDLYDEWLPTNPNAPPYCSRDDLPPDPTRNEDFSSVDLWKPKRSIGEDKKDQSGGGRKQKRRSLLQKGGGNCDPIDEDSSVDKTKLARKCGERWGKCPPITDSCMGGSAYACLDPIWKNLKFWSKRTTPESADKYLDSFRTNAKKDDEMKMTMTEEDPELGFFYHRYERWRNGNITSKNKLRWFFVKWGHYLKRFIIFIPMYILIGLRLVLKSVLKFLSGSGSSESPTSTSCSNIKKKGQGATDKKPKTSGMKFWLGTLIFAFLLGIFPFKIDFVPKWLNPLGFVLIIFGLIGGLAAAPLIFITGGYTLLPPIAAPVSMIATLVLGLFILFYPSIIFKKHGGYFGPLGKAIGENFGGLSLLFLLITGMYTNASQLTEKEKQGVYIGMFLFGIPSVYSQLKGSKSKPVPQTPVKPAPGKK